MATKAHINNIVLQWARKSAKMSIEESAKKVGCKNIDTFKKWESGEEHPTIKQAEKLSNIFRRPLAVFYLPKPPEDFQTLQDFRSTPVEFSTALVFMIREVKQKQIWAKDFFQILGLEPLSFIGNYNKNSNPNQVANDIRKTLEIPSEMDPDNVLKTWIQKCEENRIFVTISSNIHSRLLLEVEEVRGFAIPDEMAPFIFINSRDSKTANLFTLVHELAHIWINQNGVSNLNLIDFRDISNNPYDPIEVFCNRVASEAIMPSKEIHSIFNNESNILKSQIVEFAKLFGVSKIALSTKLVSLNIISQEFYNQIAEEYYQELSDYLAREEEKEIKGFPNPYLLRVNRNSRSFSNLVLSQYKSGQISGSEVSNLLGVKINNFPKYESYLI